MFIFAATPTLSSVCVCVCGGGEGGCSDFPPDIFHNKIVS